MRRWRCEVSPHPRHDLEYVEDPSQRPSDADYDCYLWLVKLIMRAACDEVTIYPPVWDFTLQRPEIDPDRIAIVGSSFGGYLAPRAASAEHRLGACVADPGQFDMFDAAMVRVPKEMKEALLWNDPAVDPFLDKMMEEDARRFFIALREAPRLAL